jgi:rod shape-determining protein MreC
MSLGSSFNSFLTRLVDFFDRRRGLVVLGVAVLLLVAGLSSVSYRRPPILAPAVDVFTGGLMTALSTSNLAARYIHAERVPSLRIMELERELVLLREAGLENERLRDLLALTAPPGFRLVAGRVIGLDLNPLRGVGWIDLGSRDGLRGDEAVLTVEGLAGVVDRVWRYRSRVRLLVNESTPVSVRDTRSRVLGIVYWEPGGGSLRVGQVPLQADIAVGDTMISSGLGGVFAPRMPVGTVERVEDAPGGLLREIHLRSFTRFSRLEEVFVLLPELGPVFDVADTSGGEPEGAGGP